MAESQWTRAALDLVADCALLFDGKTLRLRASNRTAAVWAAAAPTEASGPAGLIARDELLRLWQLAEAAGGEPVDTQVSLAQGSGITKPAVARRLGAGSQYRLLLIVRASGQPHATSTDAPLPSSTSAGGGTDSLTGLPDRAALFAALHAFSALPQTDPRRRFTLLFVDLDGFKPINDNWGHLVGDRVLAEIAQRLRAAVRPDDLVTRFGGDEFVVVLRGLQAVGDAERVAARILARLQPPLDAGGRPMVVAASIGIAGSEGTGAAVEEIVAAADRAMYAAKRRGGAQAAWCTVGTPPADG